MGMSGSAPTGTDRDPDTARDEDETTLTVLIHEWVTGGGLAGRPLPALARVHIAEKAMYDARPAEADPGATRLPTGRRCRR